LTAFLWRNCQPNISLLFGELPFERRPQAAARAGFDAIECWWPFATAAPSDRDLDAFVRSVAEAGVQLRALNFFAGDLPGGERGIASDPRRREEFAAAVDAAVEIGGRLRVPMFNALYGNRLPGLRPEQQDAAAADALAGAAQRVAAIGASILIEPVSGVAAYPVKRAEDALRVTAAVNDASGAGNCRMLADLYHLYVNGDDVSRVIAEQAGRIGHVQIADAPGRREPGTGGAPLLDWVEALAAAGYAGAIGLEYLPFGDTVSGLQWLMELNPAIGRAAAGRPAAGAVEGAR
jgi:hydroxypyruvate isomerase